MTNPSAFETITVPAPAKLNLMLHITGQRENGYHDLQTLFQLVDFGDELRFTRRRDNEITLSPAVEGVAYEDNLIIKAARILLNHQIPTEPYGVDIHLTKRIPMGGGLGGGSSDAATVLLALNHLWQLNIPLNELAEMGLVLGADVPVFVKGQAAWAEGVGEKLIPTPELAEPWYLIVYPDAHADTGKIFSHKGLTRDTPAITMRTALKQGGRNDCQQIAAMLHPNIGKTLNLLNKFSFARMTGTGSCCFISFSSKQVAEETLKEISSQLPAEFDTFIAKGTNLSSAHKVLFGSV